MSKSAKTKVDDLLAKESHQFHEQKIHTIHAAMEVLACMADKVSTTKGRQFQVCLHRAWQAAATWSDADNQKPINQLELAIHHVTPGKCMLYNNVFQCHKWQLFGEVGTKATGSRSIISKDMPVMKTNGKDEANGVANMSANNRLYFQISLSNAESESMTWCFVEMEWATDSVSKRSG